MEAPGLQLVILLEHSYSANTLQNLFSHRTSPQVFFAQVEELLMAGKTPDLPYIRNDSSRRDWRLNAIDTLDTTTWESLNSFLSLSFSTMVYFELSWLASPLPKPDEYLKAPYVCRSNSKKSYVCYLCRTDRLFGRDAVNHFAGKVHRQNHRELQLEWEYRQTANGWSHRMRQYTSYRHRIEMLGLKRWRYRISHLFLRYLHSTQEKDFVAAVSSFAKYNLMEKLSLLELAVWKHNVLGDSAFSTLEEARDYWALDERFDPVDFFRQRRVRSGIAVIVPAILPFLAKITQPSFNL